jgi:hypothetical protein
MDVFDFGSHLKASRGLEAVAEEAPFEAEGTLFGGAGTPFEAEGTSFDAKGAVSEDPLFFLSFLFLAVCWFLLCFIHFSAKLERLVKNSGDPIMLGRGGFDMITCNTICRSGKKGRGV